MEPIPGNAEALRDDSTIRTETDRPLITSHGGALTTAFYFARVVAELVGFTIVAAVVVTLLCVHLLLELAHRCLLAVLVWLLNEVDAKTR
jgi:hypothetical protein